MRSTLKLAQVALIIKLLFENYGLFLLIYWRRAPLNAKSWESEFSAHWEPTALFSACNELQTNLDHNQY